MSLSKHSWGHSLRTFTNTTVYFWVTLLLSLVVSRVASVQLDLLAYIDGHAWLLLDLFDRSSGSVCWPSAACSGTDLR